MYVYLQYRGEIYFVFCKNATHPHSRHGPIMLLKLPIMLLSNASNFSILCPNYARLCSIMPDYAPLCSLDLLLSEFKDESTSLTFPFQSS